MISIDNFVSKTNKAAVFFLSIPFMFLFWCFDRRLHTVRAEGRSLKQNKAQSVCAESTCKGVSSLMHHTNTITET